MCLHAVVVVSNELVGVCMCPGARPCSMRRVDRTFIPDAGRKSLRTRKMRQIEVRRDIESSSAQLARTEHQPSNVILGILFHVVRQKVRSLCSGRSAQAERIPSWRTVLDAVPASRRRWQVSRRTSSRVNFCAQANRPSTAGPGMFGSTNACHSGGASEWRSRRNSRRGQTVGNQGLPHMRSTLATRSPL